MWNCEEYNYLELDISNKNNVTEDGKIKEICRVVTWESQKYINLLKVDLNVKFNYKNPQRDENWYLLARVDLKPASEVEYTWNTISEMFTALNSMTETQIEPLFPPYYYWEVDKETGEKIPTFIIVGDFHWEQVTKKEKKCLKSTLWKKYIIEEDESYLPEVLVLKILTNKFWIKNIWLEWETWDNMSTIIWEELKKQSIWFIEMDSDKKYKESDLNEKELLWNVNNIINIILKEFELLWVNLDNHKFTEKEIEWLKTDPMFLDFQKEMQKKWESEPSFENMKEEFEKLKNTDIKILQKQYKIMAFIFSQIPWFKPFGSYIKIAKKSFPDTTINTLFNDIEKSLKNLDSLSIKGDKILIEDRNRYSINIMSENLWEEKIAVMVYWKAHIPNLFKQLKEKFNRKVNVYGVK
jgi:hypothetical protein